MADETNGGVTAGDRVTYINDRGERRNAICSTVHGPETIAVVFRDRGAFDEWNSGGEFVEQTSVPAATEVDEPHTYVDGGWSA